MAPHPKTWTRVASNPAQPSALPLPTSLGLFLGRLHRTESCRPCALSLFLTAGNGENLCGHQGRLGAREEPWALSKQLWARMRHSGLGGSPWVCVVVNVWLWKRYVSVSGGDVFECHSMIACDKLCIYAHLSRRERSRRRKS